MNILAFFTKYGEPATGLTPTIRIREIPAGTLVVTDALMTETGDGFYNYDFTTYDSEKDYSIRSDGGVVLPEHERYVYAGNESYVDDIDNVITNNTTIQSISGGISTIDVLSVDVKNISGAVWDEYVYNHTTKDTYGYELATKADLNASSSTETNFITSASIVYGTNNSGDYTDTFSRDKVYWEIQESATDGITVDLDFYINGSDHKPGVFRVIGHYIGFPANKHYIELFAYNVETSGWELLSEIFMPGERNTDIEYFSEYFERHINRDDNHVKIRLKHHITTYNSSHILYLDYVELTCINTSAVTAGEVAQAVWSESTSGYTTSGSYGYLVKAMDESIANNQDYLKRIVGLVHENIYIDNPIFDSDGNMTAARLRIYSNPVDVGTSNNVIGTYNISAPGDGPGKFTSWSQIRVS